MSGNVAAVTDRLTIEKIVYPGRSLGRREGKAVFTDRGLPGEVVEIETLKTRPGFDEARTVTVLEASPDRVEPRCGHWPACSAYQEIAYPAQLRIKADQLREILSRELRLEVPGLETVPSPRIWGYRNRLRLRVIESGGAVQLAYHEPGTRDRFTPVDRCHLVSDAAAALFDDVRGLIRKDGPGRPESVEIRESEADGDLLLILHMNSAEGLEVLGGWGPGLRGPHALRGLVAMVPTRKGVQPVALAGAPWLEEEIRGVRFRIGADSFFQVNRPLAEAAADRMEAALRTLGSPRLADLYCGVGTFGLSLARTAAEVFGVESERANLDFLKQNIELNDLANVTVCGGETEAWIEDLLDRGVEAVACDPPRRGLAPAVVEKLTARPPKLLLYLSCNPSTLARDLKPLLKAFAMETVTLLDFFPHTPHIETLVVLRNRAT